MNSHPQYGPEPLLLQCENCGSSFSRRPSQIKKGRKRHCSPQCRAANSPSVLERFWGKVQKGPNCWLWTGALANGYGRFRDEHRLVPAHRFAYEAIRGPIPEGLQIDHLCRVTSCVNPEHMEAVDNRTNTLRGTSPSALAAKKTHCDRGHAFTKANTYTWRGQRCCRKCRKEQSRTWRQTHPGYYSRRSGGQA